MNAVVKEKAPLEDLMAAMDVVDTLRHQQDIAERELDGEGRQERLMQRLRELYKAQGISVPDHVLQEGIDALEQERFQYQPVEQSWRTKLAGIWVSRSRWGKPMGFLTVLGGLFSGVYFVTDVLPEQQLKSALPGQLSAVYQNISASAKNPDVSERAQLQYQAATRALESGDLDEASRLSNEMQGVLSELRRHYAIRVILKPGSMSALWRISELNESNRNYYLIVEAVDRNNNVLALNVLSEETNKREKVKTWGLRVNEQTFMKVAADKQDDGIIQHNKVGEKPIGYLQPKFSVPTSGGTITKW